MRVVDLVRGAAGGIVRRELAQPSSAKLRFARQFLDAGYSVAATAHLFDLEPPALAAAVGLSS